MNHDKFATDMRELAADLAHDAFNRGVKRSSTEPTHWPHPDYPTRSACGRCVSRFGNPPTCVDCITQKAQWDAEDEVTRQALDLAEQEAQ